LTCFFIKKIFIQKRYIYTFTKTHFSRQIYWYDFHIFKLSNLKTIHYLQSQCLTRTLS
jgi:hypothetical protein